MASTTAEERPRMGSSRHRRSLLSMRLLRLSLRGDPPGSVGGNYGVDRLAAADPRGAAGVALRGRTCRRDVLGGSCSGCFRCGHRCHLGIGDRDRVRNGRPLCSCSPDRHHHRDVARTALRPLRPSSCFKLRSARGGLRRGPALGLVDRRSVRHMDLGIHLGTELSLLWRLRGLAIAAVGDDPTQRSAPRIVPVLPGSAGGSALRLGSGRRGNVAAHVDRYRGCGTWRRYRRPAGRLDA